MLVLSTIVIYVTDIVMRLQNKNLLRGEAFTCLRQFLTYRAATITLTMILGLSQKLS